MVLGNLEKMADEQILFTRYGRWFHDDDMGRYYYRNEADYQKGNRTYLSKCMVCVPTGDSLYRNYIYPDQAMVLMTVSRLGLIPVHEYCHGLMTHAHEM